MSSTVAVVGLGVMGGAMAERLADHGLRVLAWNRDVAKARAHAGPSLSIVDSPADVRAADLILVSLADAGAMSEVLYGEHGVLAAGSVPGVLACTSTIAPADVERLREETAGVLDVGLLGNREHARQGRLRLYVGGERAHLDRVRPLLDRLAQELLHVGPLGCGMRLKLLMNLLMGVEMQAMGEALTLGVASGLDRQLVLDAIGTSGFASPVMVFKAARMSTRDYRQPEFRLRLMAKDLGLAVREAERGGRRLPLAEAAMRTYLAAVEAGHGDLDCAAIAEPGEGGSGQ